MYCSQVFVFVLIQSPKKVSEKPKGFGVFGRLKYHSLVKTGILELLYFEILSLHRKVTSVRYKVPATVGDIPRIQTTPQDKFTLIFFHKHIFKQKVH